MRSLTFFFRFHFVGITYFFQSKILRTGAGTIYGRRSNFTTMPILYHMSLYQNTYSQV